MADATHNFLFNSDRWNGLTLRDGDIVVATPAKCGTTWTQRILSLLIFDSPVLYAPMSRISPWLDMNTRPLDDVLADLDAQTHRRFVKSHLDYDHLPRHEGLTYVTVGRDPRDVGLSWIHHADNVNMETLITRRIAAVGAEDIDMSDPPDFSGSEVERFTRWTNAEASIDSLAGMVAHLRSFWDHRNEPNVVVLHYADLQRDLPGEMARLAQRLGIDLSRARIDALAAHAEFAEMKSSADQVAPNTDIGLWNDTSDFFHSGKSGQWRDVLDADTVAAYDRRIAELADKEFVDWLHTGTSQHPE